MIYESQVHRLLQEERHIDLFPICSVPVDGENIIHKDYSATDNATIGKSFTLPKSKEFCFDKSPTSLEVGNYYHPQSTNCPTIDSLLVQPTPQEPPILLVFQITTSKDEREANKTDLDMVDKLAAADTEKHLVVVTLKGVRPKITVPRGYLTERFLDGRKPDVDFPVYHLQIDF